jgi:alkaline phosphatase D
VLFPLACETARNPAYACREDSWHAYPETRDRVLRAILRHRVENVVFIAGDAHCASSARVRLTDGRNTVQAYCITCSALYAPLPFANSKPRDYIPHTFIDVGENCTAEYTLAYEKEAFVTERNFTQVIVTRVGEDWRIEAKVFGENGRPAIPPAVLRGPSNRADERPRERTPAGNL